MRFTTGEKKSIIITKMSKLEFERLLRENGFRATGARVDVLEFLEKQKRPVGIHSISKAAPKVNATTLYRMMTDFVAKGIVKAYELGHGHTDYELAARPHHHHVVCESCGDIEDVFPCGEACRFVDSIRKTSKKFKVVTRQATTFYGICRSCVG